MILLWSILLTNYILYKFTSTNTGGSCNSCKTIIKTYNKASRRRMTGMRQGCTGPVMAAIGTQLHVRERRHVTRTPPPLTSRGLYWSLLRTECTAPVAYFLAEIIGTQQEPPQTHDTKHTIVYITLTSLTHTSISGLPVYNYIIKINRYITYIYIIIRKSAVKSLWYTFGFFLYING